jgi:heat shock protein HslJ
MKTSATLILLFAACSPKQSVLINTLSLQGTWKLSSINKESINTSEYATGTPELTFNVADKNVTGSSGCNRVTGNFTLEKENTLTFSPLVATRMFCPGGGEQKFLEILQSVTHYQVEGDTLILLSKGKESMKFTAIK